MVSEPAPKERLDDLFGGDNGLQAQLPMPGQKLLLQIENVS